jgi:hypothetical protein
MYVLNPARSHTDVRCIWIATDRQDQLAFVGLGEMGKRMAANLAKHLAESGQVGPYPASFASSVPSKDTVEVSKCSE